MTGLSSTYAGMTSAPDSASPSARATADNVACTVSSHDYVHTRPASFVYDPPYALPKTTAPTKAVATSTTNFIVFIVFFLSFLILNSINHRPQQMRLYRLQSPLHCRHRPRFCTPARASCRLAPLPACCGGEVRRVSGEGAGPSRRRQRLLRTRACSAGAPASMPALIASFAFSSISSLLIFKFKLLIPFIGYRHVSGGILTRKKKAHSLVRIFRGGRPKP